MAAKTNKASLDEIFSKRQFSVRSGPKGDMLQKVYKAPASWNAESRSATFVMSAQVKDRYGDIVVSKGGDFTDFNENPVCLWGHDSRSAPIGMWSNLKVVNGTPKRLEGVAELGPEGTTEKCDEVARLLAAGMVRACSIGFMIKDWEPVDKDDPWGGWQFNEWELLECSICSVPANPLALVKAAGGNDGAALQAIELVLDEWTRTPAGTIVPRSAFEKAYSVVKKADAPTLVEVRTIEDNAEDDKDQTMDQKSLVRSIVDGITEALTKALKTKSEEGTGTDESADNTDEEKAAKEKAEAEAAEKAKADAEKAAKEEEERKQAEAEAAQRELDEQEELALRARALDLAS